MAIFVNNLNHVSKRTRIEGIGIFNGAVQIGFAIRNAGRCRWYLISVVAMELRYLQRSHAKR